MNCETADVVLPDTLSPCSVEEMAVLRNSYDPLASCNDYGISTFMNVKSQHVCSKELTHEQTIK